MSKVFRHSDGSWRDYPEQPELTKEMLQSLTSDINTAVFEPSATMNIFLQEKQIDKNIGKKDAIGDLNKPRLSLIPQKALWALGGALTYGEKHYGTHNWRGGIKISYLLDAALRHINEFNAGENIDQKSQNHHLGNAMANLAMAIELSETNPEMDDRYKK